MPLQAVGQRTVAEVVVVAELLEELLEQQNPDPGVEGSRLEFVVGASPSNSSVVAWAT
jgi:hypothetical protein